MHDESVPSFAALRCLSLSTWRLWQSAIGQHGKLMKPPCECVCCQGISNATSAMPRLPALRAGAVAARVPLLHV
eukprot:4193434-Alexandrium_andersonii.AAC.1